MIIFFNMGFIFLVVLLLIFLVIGGFGIANAFLQAILDHWYILLLAMAVKSLLDCFLYYKIAKKTKTRNADDKILLKKSKNQMIICNTIISIILFCSMYLFLQFEMSIISDHMFLSVIYAIVYFAGIFGAFLQTCLCFSAFVDKSNIEMETWIGGYGSSPAVKYKKWQVVASIIFTISLIVPSLFWMFVLLCISVVALFYTSISSSLDG